MTITERVGQIDDIVNAVLLLASPGTNHITGQNLVVEGGWTLRNPLPEDHPELPVEE